MATSHTIHITPENTGLWHLKQSEEAAKKVTQLLQDDLEKHHCFFNDKGYHNHISHQLLALYGIGASAEHLQKAYHDNETYQRSPYEVRASEVEELKDFEKAKLKLGDETHYTDFLVFFQNEIDEKGWQAVLNEYLFNGDERSTDLLMRMLAGFLHPIIQLMYGIEWQQPAIVAMALAQAAVHKSELKSFLLSSEEAAKANASSPMPEITSLYEEVAKSKSAFSSSDATDEAIRIAAKVNVKPEELDEKTIEMFNAAAYYATGAAVREGKEARFDFFMMHNATTSPFFLTINAQPWIPTATKVRLLEWKIRFDIVEFAARLRPEVSMEKITSYTTKTEAQESIDDLLPRIYNLTDDGHTSKLVRAMRLCEEAGKPYEAKPWMTIRGPATWAKLREMVVEGAEGAGPTWVRGAGLAEAWVPIPNRV